MSSAGAIRFVFIAVVLAGLNSIVTYSQQSGDLKPSLLWEISRSDLSYKSYIFGTNHFVSTKLIDTSEVVNSILKSSRLIVTETADEGYDTLKLLRSVMMKKNEEYSFETDEDEIMVSEYIDEVVGTGKLPYNRIKPMAIYLMLNALLVAKRDSSILSNKFVPIDYYFIRFADENGKEKKGLEETDEQISLLLDSISITRQTEMLVNYIRNKKAHESIILEIDSCYRNLDIDCLLKYEIFGSDNTEEYRILIINRNYKWYRRLPEFINYTPTFIAVGAGHFFGEFGLLNLLKNAGYELKPVYLN